MAGYKETPRQKMIAMMYLVLTALLALNVSKDILNAFVIVNDSLVQTNTNFEKKIQGSYANFDVQYSLNPNKVRPYLEKATQIKKLSADLVNYINKLKNEVVARTEKGKMTLELAQKTPLNEIAAKDNYDTPTNFFMGESQDGSRGKARELKNKINDYKHELYKILGRDTAFVKIGLSTKDERNRFEGRTKSWEFNNFYHTILAGSVTLLNKYILDIHNTESDIITHLYKSITAEDFKFDQVGAKVIAKSNYVLQGDSYDADIIVAAYDTKQNPEIFIKTGTDSIYPNTDLSTCLKVEGARGVGKLKFAASALGPQKYAGVIRIVSPSGEKKSYNFSQEYIVAKPSVTVSADKMNVFYIGVDNPVSISVPGIPMEKLKPTISAGTLTPQGQGKYVVRVTTGTKTARVNVSADVSGKTQTMGFTDFRVKTVPDPAAYIANVKGGGISKERIIAAGAIIPQMENFDFDLFFKVTEFKLGVNMAGDYIQKTVSGNQLSAEMKKIVNGLHKGQRVFIDDIKAKGPDGTTRSLAPINLTIN